MNRTAAHLSVDMVWVYFGPVVIAGLLWGWKGTPKTRRNHLLS